MMIRFSPPSEFSSPVSPIEGSPVGQRGGRLPERLPAASIGPASAGVHDPFKATIPRVNSSDMQTRNSASNRALIASGSPLERGNISDALRDVVAVCFAFMFVASVGVGFAISLFILLFVEV